MDDIWIINFFNHTAFDANPIWKPPMGAGGGRCMWEGVEHGFTWICVDLRFGPGNGVLPDGRLAHGALVQGPWKEM